MHWEVKTEEVGQIGNSGNFISTLINISNHDKILTAHLSSVSISHEIVKHNSATIQNEIINILYSDIMLNGIVEEINNVKFYSVLVDEVTSHNNKELTASLRFVDKDKNIRKSFIGFLPFNRITGLYIAETIMSHLKKAWMELNNILIQGYNGVSDTVASMLDFRG